MNAETKLNTLYRIGSRVSLNKEQAKEFVGGRYRLEKLIAEKKIRAIKTGTTKMSPYATVSYTHLTLPTNREV